MTLTGRHLFRSLPLLLLTSVVALSAHAAETYLKVIPSTALAWGAVNHMSEASGKIQKLATVVQAPAVSALEEIKKETGLAKGLDEKGAVGQFGVPGKSENDASVGAFFVAVADEKEFLSNFEVVEAGEKISEVKVKTGLAGGHDSKAVPEDGRDSKMKRASHDASTTYCLSFRNGYALLARKSDRAAVEAAIGAKQSIAVEMAGLESWLAENDASVVGIKYAAKYAAEELKKSKNNLGGGPEVAMVRSFIALYGKVVEAAPQEFSLLTAGIRCDKESSIRVVGRARLVNGGEVSKAVAEIPPVTENLLSGMPGGSFVLAAGGVGVPRLADGYMSLAAGLMTSMKSLYGMSAEDLQGMSKQSFEVFRTVRAMNFVMKTGKRGDPIYSNIFCVMRVDNSQRVLDLQEKAAENMSKLTRNAKQGMLKSMTGKRLEIAGKPALQQELTMDLSSMAGPEANRAVMDELMGIGGKLLYYFVAADEQTVLMGMGVSQERMAAALGVVKMRKSLADDADVCVTAALLPANSQWVVYVSPRGYLQLIQRLMTATLKNSPAAGALMFSLPQFPKCPPVGFAVKASPTELHAEIAVPFSLVQATGEFVKDV